MRQQIQSKLYNTIDVVLSSNPFQRSAFLALLISAVTALYLSWTFAVYLYPPAHQYINPVQIRRFLPICSVLLVIALSLYTACKWIGEHSSRTLQLTMQSLVAIYYAIDMIVFGYIIGSMSMAAGAVLLGSPIFGLFLLDSKAVYVALIVGVALMLLFCYLAAIHMIAYAPALNNLSDIGTSRFWFFSMCLFVLPFFIVVCVLCDLIIRNLRKREADIRYLAERDHLTSLYNRLSISNQAKDMLTPDGRSCAIILLDLDHFKAINDQYGHPCGDTVLQITAQVLQDTIRRDDVAGRFGGEEFIVLMQDTQIADAMLVAERIRRALAATIIQHQGIAKFQITASLGVASILSKPDSLLEHLVQQADIALYKAKHAGRNCAVAL
jgi:diguanylate cyclase (GGDEF)-like protein